MRLGGVRTASEPIRPSELIAGTGAETGRQRSAEQDPAPLDRAGLPKPSELLPGWSTPVAISKADDQQTGDFRGQPSLMNKTMEPPTPQCDQGVRRQAVWRKAFK